MKRGSGLVLLALVPLLSSCAGFEMSSRDGGTFVRFGKTPDDGDSECVFQQVGIDRDDIMLSLGNPFTKKKKGRVLMYMRSDDARVRFRYAPPCGDMEGWKPSSSSYDGAVGFGLSYNW